MLAGGEEWLEGPDSFGVGASGAKVESCRSEMCQLSDDRERRTDRIGCT
jgi:hypothetical protein